MKLMKWLNTIAFAVMIAVNGLANLLPIGGNTTAQVSERWPSLFTPAPYTFAIWGVIYALMAIFVLYQWELFDSGMSSRAFREAIGPWFMIGCLLNTAWILCWHLHAIPIALICIIALLVTLFIIEFRLPRDDDRPVTDQLSRIGFHIYTGWIAAATIANAEVLLTKIGISSVGVTGEFRAIAALLLGTVVCILALLIFRKWLMGLAMIWAYVGILVRHLSAVGYNGMYWRIILFDIICILTMMGCVCIALMGCCPSIRRRRHA
ncbi:MAG: tryptophan-rich sensory protein [Clostridia bacterium]|nr:tryptophan-rich sensory protein [Clostridia bacterium]